MTMHPSGSFAAAAVPGGGGALGSRFSPSLAESGYWEKRDEQALVEEIANWNSMIAGFVGGMKDKLGGKDIQAEITKFPNYEHLEAKGGRKRTLRT